MKIRIRSDNVRLTLPVPTDLVFSKAAVWIAFRIMNYYLNDSLPTLPSASMERLFAELQRTKHKYSRWTLVEVRTADGKEVTVTL